jgi:hypothetical protein
MAPASHRLQRRVPLNCFFDGFIERSMSNIESNGEGAVPEDAVGIVVQDGRPTQAKPKAIAFVWGGKVRPQPSLPYGRWKRDVRPAA